MDCTAPQRSDEQMVRHAIAQLRQHHQAFPFAFLREYAVQAELKRYLDEALGSYDRMVDACIRFVKDEKGMTHDGSKEMVVRTDRVRMEASMCCDATWVGKSGIKKEAKKEVDIALYKSDRVVRLQNYGNGIGDIVLATHEEDVSCLIEVKASPTNDKQEAAKFGKDMAYLLCMRDRGIAGFFVFLDKTSKFYEGYRFASSKVAEQHVDWTLCHRYPAGMPYLEMLQQSFVGSNDQNLRDPSLQDLWVSQSAPAAKPYVEVFNLSTRDPQQYHYYAFLQPRAA